jgi:hypothetical protein
MPPVRRRLLNLLTWLSLLLFLGLTVLAVRSHWIYDLVTVRWNPVPAERLSSGYVINYNSWPGSLSLNVVGVTDADAPFWREALPRVAPGLWSYTVGGDGRAMRIRGGHYRGIDVWRKWLLFRYDRAEQAPSPLGDGTAARVVSRVVVVPHWSMMLLAAALPLARLRGVIATRRRTARAAGGRCVVCGYDLRATPGRCPECGTKSPA